MKKRIFAGLLAFMMILSVVPATEVSATSVSGGNLPTVSGNSVDEQNDTKTDNNVDASQIPATMSVEDEPVAQTEVIVANEEELKAALLKGGEIVLDENIETDEVLKIIVNGTKIVGGENYTITGTAEKVFEVYEDATFDGVFIKNTAAKGRCVDTRKAVKLNLNQCILTTTSNDNNQPLTIGGAESGTKVQLLDTEINAGIAGYGIISFVQCEINVNARSHINGYSAFYMKKGTAGSVIDVADSVLNCSNPHSGEDGNNNDFGMFVLEDNNITINISNGASLTVSASGKPNAKQAVFALSKTENSVVNVADGVSVSATVGESYIVTGYDVAKINKLNLPVALLVEAGFVAIDSKGMCYKTLEEAVAVDGEIKLLKNVDMSDGQCVNVSKTVTLDLNGKTISGSADPLFKVTDGTLEFTGSGTIKAKNDAIRLHGNEVKGGSAKTARVIIGKEVAVMSDNANCIYLRGNGAVADVYGYLESKSTEYAAIQGNGTVNDSVDYGHTVLNIYSSASVINENDVAIYHPQSGKVYVEESNEYAASIVGVTGIEMRAGELTVEGGYIASTGAFAADSNGNGSTVKGAAIVVSQHSTDIPTKVVIKNGAIEAVNSNGKAFYEADLHNQNPYGVEVEIKGGDFTGAIEFVDLANKKVISGGWFDREVPAAYVATGCNAFNVTDEDTGKVRYGVCSHSGTTEHGEGYAAACTYTGVKEHYRCYNCRLFFADAAYTTVVTEDSLIIPATGHNFVDGVCKNGCGVTIVTEEDAKVSVAVEPVFVPSDVSAEITNEKEMQLVETVARKIMLEDAPAIESVQSVVNDYAKDEKAHAKAEEALKPAADEEVIILVTPYLETEITAVDSEATDDKALITIEMNLLYDVVAAIDSDTTKSVILESGKKVENPKPMDITFAIPADVIDAQALKAAGKVLYMKHPKADGSIYYHEATIQEGTDVDIITFHNDKGFSEFNLMIGDEVPADKVVSTSAPAPAATIAMYAETGKYIEVSSVSESIIEEGKDELRTLIGDSYGKYRLALAADLHADLKGSTKIKILVDDVTAADAVIILHKGADGWEAISNKAGDGYVIGKFSSLSPVLVFVDEDGELEAAQNATPVTTVPAGSTTPAPTGDSSMTVLWIGVLAIAAMAVVCTFVYNKKRRV